MQEETKTCALCDGVALKRYTDMLGYQEGMTFDIYECTVCNASFVWPLHSDEAIYNHIYRQAASVPGYTRYYRFAALVTKVPRPLDVLSNLENVYWAIRESLRICFNEKKNISIIEIGSGLGYLTYSLNKAGYATKGLDLSSEAVAHAKDMYGDLYEAGDLFIVAEQQKGMYDCVVMTELIEHVENPKQFIIAALSLLKSGGKLIMTTPNKSVTEKGTIWQSDVPPVHVWWFAEESISKLATSLGKQYTFLDFTPFTSKFFDYAGTQTMEQIQASLPRLLANGDVAPAHIVSNWKSKILGVRLHSLLAYIKLRMGPKSRSARSSSMCAIITN